MCGTETSCGCGTGVQDSTPASEGLRSTFTVSRMTCGGCAKSVTTQVGQLDAVSAVQVDVATGQVRVTSDTPLDTADVRAAIEKAGYQPV
jgi:copper chaperone CopZ